MQTRLLETLIWDFYSSTFSQLLYIENNTVFIISTGVRKNCPEIAQFSLNFLQPIYIQECLSEYSLKYLRFVQQSLTANIMTRVKKSTETTMNCYKVCEKFRWENCCENCNIILTWAERYTLTINFKLHIILSNIKFIILFTKLMFKFYCVYMWFVYFTTLCEQSQWKVRARRWEKTLEKSNS